MKITEQQIQDAISKPITREKLEEMLDIAFKAGVHSAFNFQVETINNIRDHVIKSYDEEKLKQSTELKDVE